ncbi:MAG: hypothetical protein Q8P81_01410 [Nanoarchaeota archaeon]|nr:hypothetical protein [Nanoarchaeota archaeon]
MSKEDLRDLLKSKMISLTDRDLVSEISEQERILLDEEKRIRDGIFIYEDRDPNRIAKLLFLMSALNTSRFKFQIEYGTLFVRARERSGDFERVISSDTLKAMVDSYGLFVDQEMHLKPFDDSYITLRRYIDTIEHISERDLVKARGLCVLQRKQLDLFYNAFADIPFQKDQLVKERYEKAMESLGK